MRCCSITRGMVDDTIKYVVIYAVYFTMAWSTTLYNMEVL